MRRDWDGTNDPTRVRVFIDHWEFSLSWQIAYSGFTGGKLTKEALSNAQHESKNIDWQRVPESVLEHLDELDFIGADEKELRNIDVYASTRKGKDQKLYNDFKAWLDESLDPLPGFQVHPFDRKSDQRDVQCGSCGASLERPELEKGLKTKIACDLLSYAVKDLYDIAVLFADDPELSPSVLCVQEVFDKKVIHVGLKTRGQALRSAAWGHVLLDDFMRDFFRPEDFKARRK